MAQNKLFEAICRIKSLLTYFVILSYARGCSKESKNKKNWENEIERLPTSNQQTTANKINRINDSLLKQAKEILLN